MWDHLRVMRWPYLASLWCKTQLVNYVPYTSWIAYYFNCFKHWFCQGHLSLGTIAVFILFELYYLSYIVQLNYIIISHTFYYNLKCARWLLIFLTPKKYPKLSNTMKHNFHFSPELINFQQPPSCFINNSGHKVILFAKKKLVNDGISFKFNGPKKAIKSITFWELWFEINLEQHHI